jgi:protein-arginine deiminase
VGGKDVFEKATEDALATRGMTVHWVEDWDTYHRNLGEVHCGSNTRRLPSKAFFWTGAR